MMLVRLRAANLLNASDDARMREIQPVHLAQRLGYATDADEWEQDPESWGLASFPRRFLRLLRRALDDGRIDSRWSCPDDRASDRRYRGVRLRPRTAGWHEGRT